MVNQYLCILVHIFLPEIDFLNQWKGMTIESISWSISIKELPDPKGIEPATSWSPVKHTSNWATDAGYFYITLLLGTKQKCKEGASNAYSQHVRFIVFWLCWGLTASTHVGHFVSSPREREKRNRGNSREDERKGEKQKWIKVKKQKK